VSRVLRPRDPIFYFGGDDSEDELDAIEDHDSDGSVMSASDLDTSDSDSEAREAQEDAENEPASSGRRRKYVFGKDKHKWCVETPENRGRRSGNIAIILPRVIGASASSHTPIEFWNALFSDEILQIILQRSNEEIQRYVENNHEIQQATYELLTMNELKAFLGILYYCGITKSKHVNLSELWSRDFGASLCKVTMSLRRFEFISCRLRFDDKLTRAERRATDVLAPVREIWDIFIRNCQANYYPSEYVTIDEQLLGFRGRFSARVYIKSKPARYGIKIVSLNDAKTFYMFNAIPYVGQVQTEPGESVPSYYVRKLSEPIYNSGRNITCDNWFTSVPIFDQMKDKFNLTMVGTMRKNKRQIPESFKRNASVGTTRYGYDGKNILVSFCPKKNKVVLLLSSKHKTGRLGEGGEKPEIIEFYNKTKCGTDVFDQLAGNYSCARTTNRWPMRFFFGMLDQAAVNACILYNFLPENKLTTRRDFLKELTYALITPHLFDRIQKPGLHSLLRANIQDILSRDETVPIENNVTLGSDKLLTRKRCAFCQKKDDKKTKYCCARCQKPTCENHRKTKCLECTSV